MPLVFDNTNDYNQIKKDNKLDVVNLTSLAPNQPVTAFVTNSEGQRIELKLNHSLTAEQIGWFKAGSAMNAANSN